MTCCTVAWREGEADRGKGNEIPVEGSAGGEDWGMLWIIKVMGR